LNLENVVPWGRNLNEYKKMFLLSEADLKLKILGCADGPSSFNYEASRCGIDVTSIDPVYKFTKEQIRQRIVETSNIVRKQLELNHKDFIWNEFKNVDTLVELRLDAMSKFLDDYEVGQSEGRYKHALLPNLPYKKESFDLVLSSHFLFLYSENFDFEFHLESILKMCEVAKKEVRIFPIVDLNNKKSKHLSSILEELRLRDYECKVIKTKYEFQKEGDEMLQITI